MPRHHTIGHPAKRIEAEVVDGVVVKPGYIEPSYQEDVPFTAAEELARDAEEAENAIYQAARVVRDAELVRLHGLRDDDTMTLPEMRKMLRMESGADE